VEIMGAVGIVALILAVAIPSFNMMRRDARVSQFTDTLETLQGCFQEHVAINRGYPADASPGVVPGTMDKFLPRRFSWAEETPLGGHWNWDLGCPGIPYAAISVSSAAGAVEDIGTFEKVDVRIDDGDLTTGSFRRNLGDPERRYFLVLQENTNSPWGQVP